MCKRCLERRSASSAVITAGAQAPLRPPRKQTKRFRGVCWRWRAGRPAGLLHLSLACAALATCHAVLTTGHPVRGCWHLVTCTPQGPRSAALLLCAADLHRVLLHAKFTHNVMALHCYWRLFLDPVKRGRRLLLTKKSDRPAALLFKTHVAAGIMIWCAVFKATPACLALLCTVNYMLSAAGCCTSA